MISKRIEFYCHSVYSSEVTERAFLTPLFQIKYATPDTTNVNVQSKKPNFHKSKGSGLLV